MDQDLKIERSAYYRLVPLHDVQPLRFAQYQQWHDVFLAGPMVNVVGNRGNDFPGFYYYDPTSRQEYVGMVEGVVDWRQAAFERRIVPFRHGFRTQARLAVGLFSRDRLDGRVALKCSHRERTLPGGVSERSRDAMPDQWEALETLVGESFELLPLPAAGRAHDWEHAAEKCLATLNKRKVTTGPLPVFVKTFASDSSYRVVPIPKKEFDGTSELICQAGLAAALLAYAAREPQPKRSHEYEQLGRELARGLPLFFDKKTLCFQNTYPPRGEEWSRAVVDTWYLFHNLCDVMTVATFTKEKELVDLSLAALERAGTFVKACNYQIPLFAKLGTAGQADNQDGSIVGFALNPSVLGMYANCLVTGARLQPDKRTEYYEEAIHALELLRRWPLNQLFHQTVQLSWAAAAAHEVGKKAWRDDFLRCLLLNCYRQKDHAGLFQACTGLCYPAFRETVEAVEPWAGWLTEAPAELHLPEILRLVLNKARHFLCTGEMDCLPQEGLATPEQPTANNVGVAVYAAPQVFDLARLQRAVRL